MYTLVAVAVRHVQVLGPDGAAHLVAELPEAPEGASDTAASVTLTTGAASVHHQGAVDVVVVVGAELCYVGGHLAHVST